MLNKCNQALRSIADSSAIKQSLIPVFICDDKLLVASKSFGAQKNFSRPALNGCISNYISKEAADRINSGCASPFYTLYDIKGPNESYVIITQGIVKGEVYRAFVIQPQIVFLRTPDAWYITDAFKHLSKAVDELLNDPLIPISRLELCCLRVSKLCDFSNQLSTISNTDISYSLREIMDECRNTLISLGGHAQFHIEPQPMFVSTCSNNHIYMLTSSIIVAAIPLSADGNIDIYYSTDENNDRVEISHTVVLAKEYRRPFENIDEFISSVPHLRLELAALKDMTEHCDIEFNCRTDGEKLTIYYDIYARKTNYVVLGAPILQDESKNYLTRLFNYLHSMVNLDKCE